MVPKNDYTSKHALSYICVFAVFLDFVIRQLFSWFLGRDLPALNDSALFFIGLVVVGRTFERVIAFFKRPQ